MAERDRAPEAPRPAGRRERLDRILNLVIDRGHLGVDELVTELGISPATARRDLDALASQQLLIRSHGGAAAHPDSSALPLRYRASRRAAAKEAIARYAAGLVEPGAVIGLNGGTTTTALAQELGATARLQDAPRPTVLVTNAVNIAHELAVRRHLQLVLTGGVVRESSYELVGSWADQLLAQISIDVLFLGVDALSAEHGARTHDESEASISARLIDRSARTVVVADSTKIAAAAFARITPIQDVDDLVTDAGADPVSLQELRDNGVRVHVAGEERGRS